MSKINGGRSLTSLKLFAWSLCIGLKFVGLNPQQPPYSTSDLRAIVVFQDFEEKQQSGLETPQFPWILHIGIDPDLRGSELRDTGQAIQENAWF